MTRPDDTIAMIRETPQPFETLYIQLRDMEGRLHSDEEVKQLPEVHRHHVYRKEWEQRKWSCTKLSAHLAGKNCPLNILEVGCGNGWLANQLASIPDTFVTGMDINLPELNQASRVFSERKNLQFVFGNFNNLDIEQRYDVIVFAASIQYFHNLTIIDEALNLLRPDGEIHVIDTHFYQHSQVHQAKKRSEKYFTGMGMEEMTAFYFHHGIEDLKAYHHKILYDPSRKLNKFLGRKHPFPWICITKE